MFGRRSDLACTVLLLGCVGCIREHGGDAVRRNVDITSCIGVWIDVWIGAGFDVSRNV